MQGSRKGWNRYGAQEIFFCSAVVGAFLFFVSFGSSSADIVTPPGGGSGSYSTSVPGQGTKPDGVTVVKAVPPAVWGRMCFRGRQEKCPRATGGHPWHGGSRGSSRPIAKPAMNALSWQVFSEPFVFQPQKGGWPRRLNISDSARAAMKDGTITAGEGFMLEVVGDDTHGLGDIPLLQRLLRPGPVPRLHGGG